MHDNILIADLSLPDLDILLSELPADWHVERVASAEQALASFWRALATPSLRALHVLAHGEPGAVMFAGEKLTAQDFTRRFDGAAARDLDIAFWACRTGAEEAGQAFVAALAQATGARVAASEQMIGDGAWSLTPAVTPPFTAAAQAAYAHTLPTTPTFSATPTTYTVDMMVNGLALGDLNNDGKLDIQTTSQENPGSWNANDEFVVSNQWSTLINAGSGFTRYTHTQIPFGSAKKVRLADMNSDGKLDMIGATDNQTLYISWGNGAGGYSGYATPLSAAPGQLSGGLSAVADFNHDGKLDLAVLGGQNGQNTVNVALGVGNGTFAATPWTLQTGVQDANYTTAMEAADLNGDGYADIVTLRSDGQTQVAFGGASQLTLGASYSSASNNRGGSVLALGDLNGDGKADMVTSIDFINSIAVRLNQGNGTFGAPAIYGGNVSLPSGVAIGDLNGDGANDIVVSADTAGSQIYVNNGNGTFNAGLAFDANSSDSIALGDVNQDGKLDIVATLRADRVGVWLNTTATGDVAAPVLASAAVNGATLTLTFNDDSALDTASTAPLSAYLVKVNGVTATLTGAPVVNASGKTVTLTLAAPVNNGQTVQVSYSDPSSANDVAALQDAAGNDVASFSNAPVTNQTAAMPGPALSNATVNGATLLLSYANAASLSAQTAPLSAFAVKVDGVAAALTGSPLVNTASKTIALTLASAVSANQTVQVAYTDPTTGNDANAVQDSAGNDAASVPFTAVTNQTVSNVGPVFASATASYDKVTLTFNSIKNLSDVIDDYMSFPGDKFTVTVNGAATMVNSNWVDSQNKQVFLSLSKAVRATDVVTVSYTDPSSANDTYALQDVDGVDAASFGPAPVTVQTPVDNDGPVLSSARISGNLLTLSYTDLSALNSVGPLFTVKVDGVTASYLNVNKTSADSKDLLLTLATPVEAGQVVQVSYAPTSYSSLTDVLGNAAAPVTDFAVSNQTAPTHQLAPSDVNYTLPNGPVYTVRGNALDNTLTGNTNVNKMYGGDGNDTLNGGADDYLYGENGNDTLVTVPSSGRLFGGQGDDRYLITANGSHNGLDTLVYEQAGEGVDTVVFNQTNASYSPSSLTLPGNVENLIARGNVGFMNGNALNNYLVGSSATGNNINGLAGNDTVVGQGGHDTVQGGDGNDVLAPVLHTSQLTADTPRVLTGNITLNGGAGADTFVLPEGYVGDYRNAGTSSLYISDFTRGVDKLSFTLAESAAAPTAVNAVMVTTQAALTTAFNQAASLGSAAAPKLTAIAYNGVTHLVLDQSDASTFSASSDLAFTFNGATPLSLSDLQFTKLSQVNLLQPGSTLPVGESDPPVFAQASVNGLILTLSYQDASALSASAPAANAFTVTVNGVVATVSAVAVNVQAKTVALTLAAPVLFGQTVTVAYADPSPANDLIAIQDSYGNDAASLAAVTVSNLTPDTAGPTLTSATVNGGALTLGYADVSPLDAALLPALSAFAVKVDGAVVALTGAPVVNAAAKTLTLTLATPVSAGQTVTVSYTDPSSNNDANAVQDSQGNDAASIVNFAVVNQSAPNGKYVMPADLLSYTAPGSANLDIDGNDLNNRINGNAGNNAIAGGAGNDTLVGAAGNDSLQGGDGDDLLDGGLGADLMAGGAGNDSYNVNDLADVVTELANEGNDSVAASISYTLGNQLENLNLLGSAAINAIGNALNNRLTGNTGNNLLSGGVGNDTLSGGAGDDTLQGGDGNDVLDGGAGADLMTGGLGNDGYNVNDAGDVVTELANEGVDAVAASISHTLSDNVENLNLLGADAINGTGNALANTLLGNSAANRLSGLDGNDILDGKGGGDTLEGGQGNDTYYVDDSAEQVIELANEGADVVYAKASYILADNVETLRAAVAGLSLQGNAQNNVIYGAAGADALLDGGAGNDVIYTQGDAGGAELVHGGDGNDALYVSGVWANGDRGAAVYGDAGNDTFDTTMSDAQSRLYGGAGSDVYVVNNLNNAIIENASEGIDTVRASISFSLQSGELPAAHGDSLPIISDNVEALVLTGLGNIDGKGNALGNYLVGNMGSNVLLGRAGDDKLVAVNGNDTLDGGDGNDQLWAGFDSATPQAAAGATLMTGGAGNDVFVMSQGYVGNHSSGANTLTLADFVHGQDKIQLTIGKTATAPTALATLTPAGGDTLAGLLDQAAANATAASAPKVTVFSFSGDTYLVLDHSNAATFASGDLAIKLAGVQTVTLSDLAFVKL